MTNYAELVRDDRVHTSLYRDPAIFEAEIDRIFERTWVWVAHASELPGKNSFKSTFVGRQPVIVTRDGTGAVHVLLNRCRHRAASVCEAKRGKTSVFVCPYHGWSYEKFYWDLHHKSVHFLSSTQWLASHRLPFPSCLFQGQGDKLRP